MEAVIHKMESDAVLTTAEKDALRATFAAQREFRPRQDLLRQGERPGFVAAVLRGMLCRYKTVDGGQRQILGLPLAGDLVDLHSLATGVMDHGICALSRATVAVADPRAVRAMTDAHPRLAQLVWRDAAVEGATFREWIVNCGRRSAYARMAHLLCETYVRSRRAGVAADRACAFPLTQADLADAAGLSIVHVNRVLQALRRNGLVELKAARLVIIDWKGLVEAAGFNDAYLEVAAEAETAGSSPSPPATPRAAPPPRPAEARSYQSDDAERRCG